MKLLLLSLFSAGAILAQQQFVLQVVPGTPATFSLVPLVLPTAQPSQSLPLVPCTPPTQGIVSVTVVTDASGNTLGCLQNKILAAPNYTGSIALTNVQPGVGLQTSVVTPGNLILNVDMSTTVPASSTATGIKGQWAADSQWFYICVATNTWKRTPLLSF